ncbi:LOW QUALITY PROTEIN: hypothetical protein M8C21_031375, partial [Ambrosia artemisiifolia]
KENVRKPATYERERERTLHNYGPLSIQIKQTLSHFMNIEPVDDGRIGFPVIRSVSRGTESGDLVWWLFVAAPATLGGVQKQFRWFRVQTNNPFSIFSLYIEQQSEKKRPNESVMKTPTHLRHPIFSSKANINLPRRIFKPYNLIILNEPVDDGRNQLSSYQIYKLSYQIRQVGTATNGVVICKIIMQQERTTNNLIIVQRDLKTISNGTPLRCPYPEVDRSLDNCRRRACVKGKGGLCILQLQQKSTIDLPQNKRNGTTVQTSQIPNFKFLLQSHTVSLTYLVEYQEKAILLSSYELLTLKWVFASQPNLALIDLYQLLWAASNPVDSLCVAVV